jgi:hypothetical protein
MIPPTPTPQPEVLEVEDTEEEDDEDIEYNEEDREYNAKNTDGEDEDGDAEEDEEADTEAEEGAAATSKYINFSHILAAARETDQAEFDALKMQGTPVQEAREEQFDFDIRLSQCRAQLAELKTRL